MKRPRTMSMFALSAITVVLSACGTTTPTPQDGTQPNAAGKKVAAPAALIKPPPCLPNLDARTTAANTDACVDPSDPGTDLPTILAPNTRVLGTPTIFSSPGVVARPSTNPVRAYLQDSGALTLASTEETRQYQVGDILVGGVSSATPAGVPPSRVVAIRQVDGDLVVDTQPASLEDAVEQGQIDFEQTLTEADIAEETISEQGAKLLNGQGLLHALSVNCTKGGNGGTLKTFSKDFSPSPTLTGTISGCLRVQVTPKLQLQIRRLKLQYFEASVKMSDESELELTASGQMTFARSWELGRVRFNPVTVWLGPVPVVFTPYIAFTVGVDGRVSANINYKVSQDASYKVGVKYDRNNGGFGTINEKTFNFDAPTPNYAQNNVSAVARGYLGLKPGIQFWSTVVVATVNGDVSGEVRGYGKADIDTTRTPLWKLSAGAQFCSAYNVRLRILFGIINSNWNGGSCGNETELWRREGGTALSNAGSHAGLTWSVRGQQGNVLLVGTDASSNVYQGDTPASAVLPLLCLKVDGRPVPAGVTPDFYHGWAEGEVNFTAPVSGTLLSSRAAADARCAGAFGADWRMGEFHDGRANGVSGGWNFYANGSTLPANARFWAAINDQAANPWN